MAPSFLLPVLLGTCLPLLVSMAVPVALSLSWKISLQIFLSFPASPLPSRHPVSLSWYKSAGYLGNHHRVNTCDWSDWGLTLGWWADFWGVSLLSAVSFGGGTISGICQRSEFDLVDWAPPGEGFPVLLGFSCLRRPGTWISTTVGGRGAEKGYCDPHG